MTILSALIAGCASCPVPVSVEAPPRPDLLPMSHDLWQRVPLEAQDIFTHNDLELKRYARQLEARLEAIGGERE